MFRRVPAATGAKLLDFGLAKPVSPLASGMTLTADTPRVAMTEEGRGCRYALKSAPNQSNVGHIRGPVWGQSQDSASPSRLISMCSGEHPFGERQFMASHLERCFSLYGINCVMPWSAALTRFSTILPDCLRWPFCPGIFIAILAFITAASPSNGCRPMGGPQFTVPDGKAV